MRYPSPKNLLLRLARDGTSTTRLEALRLAEVAPASWPAAVHVRGSLEAALRHAACRGAKSAKAKLAAYKAVMGILTLNEQRFLAEEKQSQS